MSETEPRRRRSWTTQEKWQLAEEARLPGTAVAEVARRRGVNNNQLFGWIRAAEAGKLGPRPASLVLLPEASSHNEFIPIGVAASDGVPDAAPFISSTRVTGGPA